MKVLLLTQYFEPEVGAAQTRLGALARALIRRGHTVSVVTGMPNYPSGRVLARYKGRLFVRESVDGIEIARVCLYPAQGAGFKRLVSFGSFAATAWAGLLMTRRPDLLFVESPPLTLAPTGLAFARLRKVPTVLNIADPWPESAIRLEAISDGLVARCARWVELSAYRSASAISVPTDGVRTHVEASGVDPSKIIRLPNGVDLDLFAPRELDEELAARLGIPSQAQVILFAGTVGEMAGLSQAIDAMPQLVARHPQALLLIVGGGSDLDRLRRMVGEGAIPSVRFLGPQPVGMVAALYSIASVALSTLKDNPLAEITRPAKVAAALASGTPVVFAGRGEGARMLESSGAGLVVPPGHPDALAGAISTLLDDDEAARAMGSMGREFAVDHLSWDQLVDEWLAGLAVAGAI